jgi:hypothetical protein
MMIFKWLKKLFPNNTPIKEGGIVYLNTPDVMPKRPTSPMEKLPIRRKRIKLDITILPVELPKEIDFTKKVQIKDDEGNIIDEMTLGEFFAIQPVEISGIIN